MILDTQLSPGRRNNPRTSGWLMDSALWWPDGDTGAGVSVPARITTAPPPPAPSSPRGQRRGLDPGEDHNLIISQNVDWSIPPTPARAVHVQGLHRPVRASGRHPVDGARGHQRRQRPGRVVQRDLEAGDAARRGPLGHGRQARRLQVDHQLQRAALHSACGYLSPTNYENTYHTATHPLAA